MQMTYHTPTPAPTPSANIIRDGLREVYVSQPTRLQFCDTVPTRCTLRAKLFRAHLQATFQVENTR